MNKKVLLIIPIFVVAFMITMLASEEEKVIYSSGKPSIKTDNALAMMYEIETDSGEYETVDNVTWPLEGYVFNPEMSKCENGSTITWDEESQSVLIEAQISDKCYVYFDIASANEFTTSGTSDFKSIKLNEQEITVGNTYQYEIGDILTIQMNDTAAADSVLKIYDDKNSVLQEYNAFSCAGIVNYELTGNEKRIEFIKGTDYNRPSCP